MSTNVDWNAVEQQVVQLAIRILGAYEQEVRTDFTGFKKSVQDDIKDWAVAYVAGQISKDELENLVMGEKDLLTCHALKQKGVAKVALDKFTNAAMGIIFNAITKLV